MMTFNDCHDAIRNANHQKLTCVGWDQTHTRWVLYDPRMGPPPNVDPEFLCIGSGKLPIPLSDEGTEILLLMLENANPEL